MLVASRLGERHERCRVLRPIVLASVERGLMNIAQRIIARADAGFTFGQKVALTFGLLLYWIFPIDFIPDLIPILGQIDDVFVSFVMFRVWRSPTLPSK